MYSSGYSQVSKHSLQAQRKMQYHSKGKSCGYYMRIVFFFSSLIQSLIIVSLVLFLIYGKKQDSASSSRIQDLEDSFTRLSMENVDLRQQRKNLTRLLNTTVTEKARNDWDLARLRYIANISAIVIQDMDKRLKECSSELYMCRSTSIISGKCPPITGNCECGRFVEQLKARLELVQSNFTQTTERMRREMDQMAKERDNHNLQVISLRRDKFTYEKEVEFCRQTCKTDFAQSLSGISNVTKAFLRKVDTLFPVHIAFQLTCPKQRDHLEQIRTNCSSLSGEIEDKFQHYLNSVGEQVSTIQSENSRLKAENWRLSDDYRWCSQNRTGTIQQHKQNLDKLQRKHDEDKEKLLMDKLRLNGELQVLDSNIKYKSKEVEHLREQLRQLNVSCMAKVGYGGFTGGANTRIVPCQSGGLTGICSPGSSLNKQLSSGTGTSLLSSGSSSSTGLGYNRLGSTGTGSSSSSVLSSGSSSSTGYSKPGSTGSNPTGTGLNKPAVSSRGSSILSSSSGSTGSTSSLSGTGLNKPVTNVKTSSGTGSSSGSTGSTSKTGSGSFSWLGFGSSSSAQSKPGTATGKGTSTGTGYGGIGSSAGAGRTSGLGGGSVNVAQHLQDLQRLINPPGPEEKQDLSRMLG